MLTYVKSDRGAPVHVLIKAMDSAVAGIRWVARPSLAQLLLRLALAVPFWDSATEKWDHAFRLHSTPLYAFADEIKFYLPGGPYNFSASATMVLLFRCIEIIFPLLLVLGLGTRFAAAGLLLIAYLAELSAPGDWPIEMTWLAMALGVMAWGPGRLSLDRTFRSALVSAARGDCAKSL